jgi:hypothetical protein
MLPINRPHLSIGQLTEMLSSHRRMFAWAVRAELDPTQARTELVALCMAWQPALHWGAGRLRNKCGQCERDSGKWPFSGKL